ncbi:hypothetical protein [Paraburkholderia hospita]|uniref:hypothetical protein n=1 Tax=Paraburkholderia hospita TaxID=169430 RepID=UPI000271BFDD|nr:hypothetical protein [Paraburkholderia hospita]EUC21472.1 hypothetical protein PMI06_009188 [Burkholderia sp. BT03]SKC95321.1 hypothetical protein SAMN06266956_6897 [Paraburkholderia hospita]
MSQPKKAQLHVKTEAPISTYTPAQLKKEVLSKALSALSAGRITGAEATRVEAALSMGVAPQKELLQRIFGGEPLSKALGGQWQRAVGARASHPAPVRTAGDFGSRKHPGAFDRLVRELAMRSRGNR